MTSPRTRAVIVVFDDDLDDTEAAMVRNGLHMFRGVHRVIPVRGLPDDGQARKLIARDDLTRQLAKAEQRVFELSSRLENVNQAVTGSVPVPHETGDGVEWRQSS